MKRQHILAVLFFGGLWGLSEAVLGDVLYSNNVPYASVPLTIIGLVILTFAGFYSPQIGTATLIAGCAMFYKFLNEPFFACHMLGIVLLGFCYDLFFNAVKVKSRAISAALAVYVGYALFALMITYLFRYEPWVQAGFTKVIRHVGLGGTLAAAGCAVLVPLAFRLGQKLKDHFPTLFRPRLQWAPVAVSLGVAGLWISAVVTYLVCNQPI
ncbi:MAG: hypothetical protein ACYSP9_00710 [Planctomycetota bacterium]|jgi:hypothetical protein